MNHQCYGWKGDQTVRFLDYHRLSIVLVTFPDSISRSYNSLSGNVNVNGAAIMENPVRKSSSRSNKDSTSSYLCFLWSIRWKTTIRIMNFYNNFRRLPRVILIPLGQIMEEFHRMDELVLKKSCKCNSSKGYGSGMRLVIVLHRWHGWS